MNKEEVISEIQRLRMRVTEQTKAVVLDNVGVYFFITDEGIYTFEGLTIKYDSLVELNYNTHTSVFFLTYLNDDGATTSLGIEPRKTIKSEPIMLSKLLKVIIPGIETKAYHDIMRSRGMFKGSLWGKEDVFKPISDWDFERVYGMIVNALDEWGIKKMFSERLCQMALDLFMSDHQRNLWLEWVQSIKWDGTKRLDNFFRDTLGASAPALQDSGKETAYIYSVTRAFFYGAIQRAFEETVMEIIPVLISNKQGIGKTSLVRFLAGPNKDWYKSIGSAIDNEKQFWEDVNGGKIIELSESEALKTTRVNQLKSFVSKSSDTFREAYARYSATHDRHWVMIATSNEQKMFVDKTGNRRFFPLICIPDKIKYKFYDDYKVKDFTYIEQVWAEAYHDYMNDPTKSCVIYCETEIAECARIMQESSTYVDDRYIAIDEYLDDPENGLNLQGSRISRADIISKIFGENPSKPEKETTYTITKWAECTKKWKTISSTTYQGKTTRNVYERKVDHLSPLEVFGNTYELTKKYHDFCKEYNVNEFENAQIENFLTYANIPINYYESIVDFLKEDEIYNKDGRWLRL